MNASTADLLLWVAVPYICLAVFAVGHVWHLPYDIKLPQEDGTVRSLKARDHFKLLRVVDDRVIVDDLASRGDVEAQEHPGPDPVEPAGRTQ